MPITSKDSGGPGGPLGLGVLPALGRTFEGMLQAFPGMWAAQLEPPPAPNDADGGYYPPVESAPAASVLPWVLGTGAVVLVVVLLVRR